MNCLHSFRTKNKLESINKVCKDFCNIVKPSRDFKILKFYQYQKSDKRPFIIYANLETLIKKWMDVKIILKQHQHHPRKITDFKKKKMNLLTHEKQEPYKKY